jgi:hypothetical protein
MHYKISNWISKAHYLLLLIVLHDINYKVLQIKLCIITHPLHHTLFAKYKVKCEYETHTPKMSFQ